LGGGKSGGAHSDRQRPQPAGYLDHLGFEVTNEEGEIVLEFPFVEAIDPRGELN
jgi:hypothetical protein